jgi:hypothetical protein
VSRSIALLFLGPGGGGQPHASAASTPGKDWVPIVQEAGWAPGSVWTGGKSRPHRHSIPDRPARSESLYRLGYSAHFLFIKLINILDFFKYISLSLTSYNYAQDRRKFTIEAACGVFSGVEAKHMHERTQHSRTLLAATTIFSEYLKDYFCHQGTSVRLVLKNSPY